MRRHRRSIWSSRLLSLSITSLSGALLLIAFAAAVSLFALFFVSDPRLLRAMSYIPLIMSSLLSAFICGKHRRRKGLAEGSFCGLAIYLIISVFALIFTGTPASTGKFVILVISGALGGVLGVNSKRPKKLME